MSAVELTSSSDDDKRSQAAVIVDFALAATTLAVTEDGRAVVIPQGRPINRATYAPELRSWGGKLRKDFREATGKVVAREALTAALDTLAAYAAETTPVDVPLRVRRNGESILIDLGNEHYVAVTREGWTIDGPAGGRSPVFRRSRKPLVMPRRKHDLDGDPWQDFADLLGLHPMSREFRLIRGWLIGVWLVGVPRPILWALGPQGAGKTTRMRYVLGLVDPVEELGEPPTNSRNDNVRAGNHYVVTFDNVSALTRRESDWLCRLVTGFERVDRMLFTDDDLVIAKIKRAVVVTSIHLPFGLGPDALQRTIVVELPELLDSERVTEDELDARYEELRPRLLAQVLDDLSAGLAKLPELAEARRKGWPRMADYGRFLAAVDLADGFELGEVGAPGTLFEAFSSATTEQLADRIHDNPLTVAVMAAVERAGGMLRANAKDVMTQLEACVSIERRGDGWPTNVRELGSQLRDAQVALRAAGVVFEPGKRNKDGYVWTLRTQGTEPVAPGGG